MREHHDFLKTKTLYSLIKHIMAGSKNEMTAIFESGKGNKLKIALPEVEKTPQVLEAYWCDKDQVKTTVLEHKSKAYVLIKGANLDGKKIKFEAYETDFGPMNDDFIHEYEWTFSGTEMLYSFNVTPKMFVKGEEDLVHFYFTLAIEEDDAVTFCYSDDEYLKFHLVRYVPGVLSALGWNTGSALQDEWFSRAKTTDPDSTNPDQSIVKMSWALGFARVKTVHDAMITNKIWVSTKGKPALVKEIQRMVTDGKVTVPKKEGDSTAFGIFSNSIIDHDDQKIPTFDKYHYQESKFKPGVWDNTTTDLDDLTAALANFVFRMSAGGTITKTKTGYTVHVTKVATYIRDSFDFIDPGWASQDLGYWNIAKNKVSKTPGVISSGYRLIENSSYQNYQDEFDIGGDFRLFSDIKFTTVNDSFNVSTV